MGNLQPVGQRHRRGEYIATADHHDFIDSALGSVGTREAKCGIEAGGQYCARRDQGEIAGEHDIGAAWQQLANRIRGSCGP